MSETFTPLGILKVTKSDCVFANCPWIYCMFVHITQYCNLHKHGLSKRLFLLIISTCDIVSAPAFVSRLQW